MDFHFMEDSGGKQFYTVKRLGSSSGSVPITTTI